LDTVKTPDTLTRAQAERAIADSKAPFLDSLSFATHPNYHVRRKAWRKAGSHIPEDREMALRLRENLRMSAAAFPIPDPPAPEAPIAEPQAPSVEQ
jgi:hypothetical protein